MNFKMFTYKSNCVLFLLIFFQGSGCQRRIYNGQHVTTNKRYVAYLLKASVSPKQYFGWLCGGAIVSESLIVTSAACVSDVNHLYAIAGYDEYVNSEEIHSNPCTREKKKKVIYICTPKDYEMSYDDLSKWTFIDIAVVKVESPYDFGDTSYKSVCSYTPTKISINYDTKYQMPGVDAIVLGWGHLFQYRQEMDFSDFNQKKLHYASIMLMDKKLCKRAYMEFKNMSDVIDKYMICSDLRGNLDEAGVTISPPDSTVQGCGGHNITHEGKEEKLEKLLSEQLCEPGPDELDDEVLILSRKLNNLVNITINDSSKKPTNQKNHERNNIFEDTKNTLNSSLIKKMNRTALNGRRALSKSGICQNDHGGPLVTWVGAHEMLIGVATAFKIKEDGECDGPFLYTSTQCNGAFLSCVISHISDNEPTRREICTQEKEFNISQTHISWINHPDGPAENEKNTTTHSSVADTNTNATSNLKNVKEGKNMPLENNNSTILVTMNITGTLENITTSKVQNVGGSMGILTNTTYKNVIKSSSVILTSATSMNLSNTFTNLTNTNHSSSESAKPLLSNSSNSYIDDKITTILMKNTSKNLRNTTLANVYLETSTANLIKNASLARTTNLVDTTPKSFTNSTIRAKTNMTTSD